MKLLGASGSVPAPDATHVVIRPLRRFDIRAVMRIEQRVYPRPWTPSIFRSELAQRHDRSYLAATVGGELCGYAGCYDVLDDAHVTTIAVAPEWHRHKVGTRLLAELVRAARLRGARHVTLEVRVSNVGAQALYEAFGFVPAGVRRNYYEGVEDAIVMWAHDIDTAEYAARLAHLDATVPGTTEVRGR